MLDEQTADSNRHDGQMSPAPFRRCHQYNFADVAISKMLPAPFRRCHQRDFPMGPVPFANVHQ